VKALGVPPGPRIKHLLDALDAWWIDRDFAPDRDACLAELARRVAAGEDS
jgi:poly(A) polymerase